ncbi:MAG: hypothetical protein AB7O32_02640 [Vicinamibacterales bacterium]
MHPRTIDRPGGSAWLTGGQGTLATPKPLKTVGSFWPYATVLPAVRMPNRDGFVQDPRPDVPASAGPR